MGKEYPRKLYANVLLLDGEIINWKTGNKSWENENWLSSKQPINIIVECAEGDQTRLTSETFYKSVNNIEENQLFFETTSVEFYKMFEISNRFGLGFEPY